MVGIIFKNLIYASKLSVLGLMFFLGGGGGVLINFAMFEILKYKDNYINTGKNSLIVYIKKEAPKQ